MKQSKGEIDNSVDSNQSKIELSHILMPMIRPERANYDPSWTNIGKALYGCNNGDENGLNVWIKFTEAGHRLLHDQSKSNSLAVPNEIDPTSQTHTIDDCRQLYPLFQDNCLPINTLAIYAREDSPLDYAAWHEQWCKDALEDALKDSLLGELNAFVRAFYYIYWLDFISTRIKRKWYHLENQQWIEQKEDHIIHKILTDDFIPRLQQLYEEMAHRASITPEFDTSCQLMNPLRTIRSLISNLKRHRFKDSFISQAKEFFYCSTVDVNY